VKKISLGWERASIAHPEDKFGVLASTPAATQRLAADVPAALPVIGPGVANQYRESGFGVISTLIHSPVKGEHPIPKPLVLAPVIQWLPPVLLWLQWLLLSKCKWLMVSS